MHSISIALGIPDFGFQICLSNREERPVAESTKSYCGMCSLHFMTIFVQVSYGRFPTNIDVEHFLDKSKSTSEIYSPTVRSYSCFLDLYSELTWTKSSFIFLALIISGITSKYIHPLVKIDKVPIYYGRFISTKYYYKLERAN